MAEVKAVIVKSLLEVKKTSGKSYNQIAEETGLTNVYVGQLLRRQAQLKPDTASKLHKSLPGLTKEQLKEMMEAPLRSFDPSIIQDPTIYRLNEAMMHFGESIKEIVNEEFGDGIMSAIAFYCSVDKIKGYDGKERVVLTFDGKYLPRTEHISAHMLSRIGPQGSQPTLESGEGAQTIVFCFNKASWEFFACFTESFDLHKDTSMTMSTSMYITCFSSL